MFYVDNIKFSNSKLQNGFIKLRKIMSNYSIIVLRIDNNGKLTNSKPCVECLSVLKLLNIKYMHYSTNSETINTERVKRATSTHHSSYNRSIKKY